MVLIFLCAGRSLRTGASTFIGMRAAPRIRKNLTVHNNLGDFVLSIHEHRAVGFLIPFMDMFEPSLRKPIMKTFLYIWILFSIRQPRNRNSEWIVLQCETSRFMVIQVYQPVELITRFCTIPFNINVWILLTDTRHWYSYVRHHHYNGVSI